MVAEKLQWYFSENNRHKKLTLAASVIFLLLTAEKITVILSDVFAHGLLALEILEIICFFIDLSLATLIIAKVKYQYLIIPDSVFLAVKLFIAVSGMIQICSTANLDSLTKLTYAESITESLMFSLFLISFFTGEKKGRPTAAPPNKVVISTFSLLTLAFIVSVVFEIIKIPLNAQVYQYEVGTLILNFLKGFSIEVLLHSAYLLLVLMVFFEPYEEDCC